MRNAQVGLNRKESNLNSFFKAFVLLQNMISLSKHFLFIFLESKQTQETSQTVCERKNREIKECQGNAATASRLRQQFKSTNVFHIRHFQKHYKKYKKYISRGIFKHDKLAAHATYIWSSFQYTVVCAAVSIVQCVLMLTSQGRSSAIVELQMLKLLIVLIIFLKLNVHHVTCMHTC